MRCPVLGNDGTGIKEGSPVYAGQEEKGPVCTCVFSMVYVNEIERTFTGLLEPLLGVFKKFPVSAFNRCFHGR
jgi:hypothetical protein